MRRKLQLHCIHLDERAQPRAALMPDRVAEYVEDMGRGDQFPPLVVFHDRQNDWFWLADGFHRYHAAVGLQLSEIECEVKRGELRDAILYSCGANAEHGLRRTNADKTAAVSKMLEDREWSKWTDNRIAKQCRVTHPFVARLRASLVTVTSDKRSYQDKHGNIGTMRTGNIGKGRREPQAQAELALPPQMEKDNENGWISAALWAIDKQLQSLPSPGEAASRFPTCHYHTLSAEKLRGMAEWLLEFAQAFDQQVEEYNGQKARPAA
jgi:hypothetical protein